MVLARARRFNTAGPTKGHESGGAARRGRGRTQRTRQRRRSRSKRRRMGEEDEAVSTALESKVGRLFEEVADDSTAAEEIDEKMKEVIWMD